MQQPKGGLRNRMFGFFQFTPSNTLAYDISFGTVGCQLILARAFMEVSCCMVVVGVGLNCICLVPVV